MWWYSYMWNGWVMWYTWHALKTKVHQNWQHTVSQVIWVSLPGEGSNEQVLQWQRQPWPRRAGIQPLILCPLTLQCSDASSEVCRDFVHINWFRCFSLCKSAVVKTHLSEYFLRPWNLRHRLDYRDNGASGTSLTRRFLLPLLLPGFCLTPKWPAS